MGKDSKAKAAEKPKPAPAKQAKDGHPFLITARTDARGPHGLEEAIRRGNAYKQAGADLIFVEAPESVDEIQQIAREVKAPLVINMIEGGKTPILPLEQVHEMGFVSVGYVLTGIFAAAQAMQRAFSHVLHQGTSVGLEAELMSFGDFTALLGLQEKYEFDEQFNV